MANEYLTSAEFKATRTLTGETFADDDITLAISAASRAIDARCGRRFWVDGAAVARYYTPLSPYLTVTDDIVTLTSVLVDRGGDGTFEETWVENTDYTLEPLNNALEVPVRPRWLLRSHPLTTNGLFPTKYPRTVKVTAIFGWTAVPDEIKQATGLLASRLMIRARDAPLGVVSLGLEGIAGRVAREDPDVVTLLAPFVKRGPGMV